MASREQRRAELVPALAKITRRRDFRTSLSNACGDGNELTVIPVLADDTMTYVFDRLRDSDQRGVVAMQGDECFELAVVWPATSARQTVAQEDDNLAQIHGESEVGMFFGYLRERGTLVVEEIVARIMPGDMQLA